MPSLLPNFEYDIFISYRHNANPSKSVAKDGIRMFSTEDIIAMKVQAILGRDALNYLL